MRLLLDSHVLIWWVDGTGRLSHEQSAALAEVRPERPVWVSDISLWEIATLVSLGRVELRRPLRTWLERASAPPLVRRCGVTPAVAAEVAALPDSFHRDPADRILVATARVLGAKLVTKDRQIRDANLVPVLF